MRSPVRILLSMVFLLLLSFASVACGGGSNGNNMSNQPDAGMCTAGTTAYLQSCTTDSDCQSCLCFTFGQGAMLCTQKCKTNADCPAPSPGCSGMGVCKRPGG